jgi:TPR repeat protein
MDDRASEGVKRPRQQQGDKEDAQPEALFLTAHPTLRLSLLAVTQSYLGMCFSAQLCNVQGAALFPFVRLPPHVRHPFAGAPVHDMSLKHAERLRVVACALTGKLVRLLSLGTGCHFEPERNRHACHKLMHFKVGRLAAKLMHSLVHLFGKEAQELSEAGQCAAAADALKRAINVGHLPSRALLAHMMIDGREGVGVDRSLKSLPLVSGRHCLDCHHYKVQSGHCLDCHHFKGVMAWGCMEGFTSPRYTTLARLHPRQYQWALESADKGSRYGQCNLGAHYENMGPHYYVQAVALYRLAAAQNLDSAQLRLGHMYYNGFGVAEDSAEALRLYRLAAAQGHPQALYDVAAFHEKGKVGVVRQNRDEAIHWYRRAQAAGHQHAEYAWRRLEQLLPRVRKSVQLGVYDLYPHLRKKIEKIDK